MSSDRDTETGNDDNCQSSSGIEVSSESCLQASLRSYLREIRYAGSFAASKSSQRTVDPGLQVNGVGAISLPLRIQDAKAIAKIGNQAPFGRGTSRHDC